MTQAVVYIATNSASRQSLSLQRQHNMYKHTVLGQGQAHGLLLFLRQDVGASYWCHIERKENEAVSSLTASRSCKLTAFNMMKKVTMRWTDQAY